MNREFAFSMGRILLFTCLFVTAVSARAGSGLHSSLDTLSYAMTTRTETRVTYTPSPPGPSHDSGKSEDSYSSLGIRFGYKYKRRLTHSLFITPEFHLSHLEHDELVYGTNFKPGYEFGRYSVYGVVGASRVDKLEQNTLNYGLGVEVDITDTLSLNLEWQRFRTMRESSTSSLVVGSQVVTTNTDTERDLDLIKLGISIYFHE